MTDQQTPERTLAQLREVSKSCHAIGHDVSGLVNDVVDLVRGRDDDQKTANRWLYDLTQARDQARERLGYARGEIETLRRELEGARRQLELVEPRYITGARLQLDALGEDPAPWFDVLASLPAAGVTPEGVGELASQLQRQGLDTVELKIANFDRVIKQRDEARQELEKVTLERDQVQGKYILLQAKADRRRKDRDDAYRSADRLRQELAAVRGAATLPEPEPAWGPVNGDVGFVTRFQGMIYEEGIRARFDGDFWYRLDGEPWGHEHYASPDEVRVIPADFVAWKAQS